MLAVVWHYWIGVSLAVPGILLVLATIVGYLRKVVMPRYPQRVPSERPGPT
jgi:hypothetical protein